MGRLKPLPQKVVIRILEKHGFVHVRSAKHLTFKRTELDGRVLTTWVPKHREVSAFVTNYIIRQSEISRAEFES